MNSKELEERLINFSVSAIRIAEQAGKAMIGKNLSNQLNRSSTSVSLNYGEAQGAESRKDFAHKIRISLKELRESHVCMRIIERLEIVDQNNLKEVLTECNELISIFVKTTKTLDSTNLKT